jgi:hypothetical protein
MEIHIARDGQQFGPFPPEEVRRQLAVGTLLPTDYAWSEGATAWVPLGSLPTLASPPPPPESGVPPLPQRVVSMPVPAAYRTTPTSGLAVASLILGIASLTVMPGLAGIAGIVCGHLARGGIRRANGALAGDGMAVAGLITSYIGLFFMLLVLVFVVAVIGAGMALPIFGNAQMEAKKTQSLGHAKEIAVACQAYAMDHHDAFPKTLEELVPKYLPDRQVLVCPLSGPLLPVGYRYFGGTAKDSDDKILLMSKYQDHEGRRVVVRVNGSAAFEKPPPQFLPPGGL